MRFSKFFLISILCLFWQSIALASPNKTYLLISFKDQVKWGRSVHAKTIASFKKYAKGLKEELIIVKDISGTDLYKVIKDEKTKSIFWLSHGGVQRGLGGYKNVVKDIYGNDVHNILFLGHKKLKFVGIIACNSALTVSNDNVVNSSTIFWSSTKKLTPTSGIKHALKSYKKLLKQEHKEKEFTPAKTKRLYVKRMFSEKNFKGEIRVLIAGKTIGFMQLTTKTQWYEFDYPEELKDSKIQVAIEREDEEDFYKYKRMGNIYISSNYERWDALKSRSGKVFEGTKRLFLKKTKE